MQVITNNQPRMITMGFELTDKERAEFDYIDFSTDDGACHDFVRYRNRLYDLDEFSHTDTPNWDAAQADTFFSATLVRFVDDESVIMGRCYS